MLNKLYIKGFLSYDVYIKVFFWYHFRTKHFIKNIIPYLLCYCIWILPRKCPICGMRTYRFKTFDGGYGMDKQEDVECRWCGSHPRHRRIWLYLTRKKTDFMKMHDSRFLHIAPENCFRKKFKKNFKNYLTADLTHVEAMVKMDITQIQYPDNYFDIIFCNHVLEHIQDDIKALSELYRVLNKGGNAILMVPQITGMPTTYEDSSITTPEGRAKAFGLHDHFRIYGDDYLERLKSVGFVVIPVSEFLSQKEIKKYLGDHIHLDNIFHCTKS